MFMCRQVAKALAEQNYETLSPWRKFTLKLHVKLCTMCGPFHRQVMDMQDASRLFRDHEDAEDIESKEALSDECKKRLTQAIADARQKD